MPGRCTVSPPYCRTRITPPSPFKKGSAVSALSCSRNYDLCSIAMRVFRVRATRRRGTAELFAFPEAPASHEQFRAQACQGRKDRSCHKARQTRPSPFSGRGEVLRCSKRLVISTGNHALRGAVNWGAEKKGSRHVLNQKQIKATHTKPGRPIIYYSIDKTGPYKVVCPA